jgi:hypothetical protein
MLTSSDYFNSASVTDELALLLFAPFITEIIYSDTLVWEKNTNELHKFKGKGHPKQTMKVQKDSRDAGWSTQLPGLFNPRKRPGTRCTESCVDPQVPSGRVRKISHPAGLRSLNSLVRSESLYRQRHSSTLS